MSPSRGPWRDRYGYGEPEAYADWDRGEAPRGEHAMGDSIPLHHSSPRSDQSHHRVYDEESRYPGEAIFGGFERKYESRREYEYERRTQQMRRRGSPVYDEYSGRNSDPHDRSTVSSSRTTDYESRGRGHGEISSRSYSTYRQQPENERRSASPAASSSNFYFLPPKFVPRPPPPRPSHIDLPPPPPPRRTKPTKEYLATSLHPSQHLEDPTSSRKLIVLDLNGTLVLRSAHQKRNPYANPTQQRPLRTVHPRPYLSSFVSYVLHPDTKKWLDVMVWSSAQPHSVDDMVQKSFKERRKELKAVWARDTLGLSGDDYYQKTQTVKDLEKPWAELSALPPPPPPPPGAVNLSSVMSFDDAEIQPPPAASPSLTPEEDKPRHSAKTTLLVDDSPLKAILQPWNHLCIPEYVQEMRRLDLAVADWEWAAERAKQAKEKRKALENQGDIGEFVPEADKTEDTAAVTETTTFDPNVKSVTREIVMVDGQMVNAEEVVKRVSREVVMIQGMLVDESSIQDPAGDNSEKTPNSHARRKLRRMEKRERQRVEREEKEIEAFMSLAAQQRASGSNSASASAPSSASVSGNELVQEKPDVSLPESTSAVGDRRASVEPAPVEAPIQYDPTLLAVIGILDHLKHEENVASWMHSGGLLNIPTFPSSSSFTPTLDVGLLPNEEERAATKTRKAIHTPPIREGSPSDVQGHAKRRKIEEDEDTDFEIQAPISARQSSLPPAPSSPGSPGILPPSSPGAFIIPPSSQISTSALEQENDEQASTGVPTSPARPTISPSSPKGVKDSNKQKLWFEHPAVQAYWASRGRDALEQLGLEVTSGVERAPGGLQHKSP